MKTLSVQQPWAELIVAGRKKIENRTWSTNYRGPLLIHAGKSRNWLAQVNADDLGIDVATLTFGAIVGVVDLTDCIPPSTPSEWDADPFASGPYLWVLANARRLTPIPCVGKLGLFDYLDIQGVV